MRKGSGPDDPAAVGESGEAHVTEVEDGGNDAEEGKLLRAPHHQSVHRSAQAIEASSHRYGVRVGPAAAHALLEGLGRRVRRAPDAVQ